jgi:hypothetical protein
MPSAKMTAPKTTMAAATMTCLCRQVETNHTRQEGNQSAKGAQGPHREGVSDTHGLPPPGGTRPKFYSKLSGRAQLDQPHLVILREELLG